MTVNSAFMSVSGIQKTHCVGSSEQTENKEFLFPVSSAANNFHNAMSSMRNARKNFMLSMLNPDMQVSPEVTPSDSIDRFVDRVASITIKSQQKIGGGSYGTCFKCDGFVIKVPVNCSGNLVDWNSQESSNARPARVSKYLNIANDDADFSRPAKAVWNDKKVDVLVSKYVKGRELDIENGSEYDRASDLIESRGLYMHDLNVFGNVLVDDKDKLHIIDGDQLVFSETKRLERKLSVATINLEDQIDTQIRLRLKNADDRGDNEEKEYQQGLLNDLNFLRGRHSESTPES
ncbi:hypothetical protein [Erwinia mallotivora]|uniref:hypothetical protein n=1 Tax=Erwinia mallotivora TaxID=69222 RepID=UPI0021BEF152|nr:hypothetical protein [Erwinia mallotivora]